MLAQIGWDLDEHVPARPRCSQRDAALLELMVCQDLTLDEVGRRFEMTRERIRQLLKKHTGLSTRDLSPYREQLRESTRRAEGIWRLRRAAHDDPQASTRQLSWASGLTTAEVEQELGWEESIRRRRKRAIEGYQTVSDQQVLDELVRVAQLPGGTPLSGEFYDRHRGELSVGSVRILQRFGTWREACRRAGVASNRPVRRSYPRRWTTDQMIDWATAYVSEAGVRATYRHFEEWLRDRAGQGAPSAHTLRNALGTWADILELALVRRQELQEGAASTIKAA